MAEKNRNQSSQTEQRNENLDQENTQSGQRGNIKEENINVNNPQRGDEWSNYRTRELSGNQNTSSDENLSDE
jgi:hypothetical protein